MTTNADLVVLRDVVAILRPWADVSTELSADKMVTSSKVIPIIYCIRKTLESTRPVRNTNSTTTTNSKFRKLHYSALPRSSI